MFKKMEDQLVNSGDSQYARCEWLPQKCYNYDFPLHYGKNVDMNNQRIIASGK